MQDWRIFNNFTVIILDICECNCGGLINFLLNLVFFSKLDAVNKYLKMNNSLYMSNRNNGNANALGCIYSGTLSNYRSVQNPTCSATMHILGICDNHAGAFHNINFLDNFAYISSKRGSTKQLFMAVNTKKNDHILFPFIYDIYDIGTENERFSVNPQNIESIMRSLLAYFGTIKDENLRQEAAKIFLTYLMGGSTDFGVTPDCASYVTISRLNANREIQKRIETVYSKIEFVIYVDQTYRRVAGTLLPYPYQLLFYNMEKSTRISPINNPGEYVSLMPNAIIDINGNAVALTSDIFYNNDGGNRADGIIINAIETVSNLNQWIPFAYELEDLSTFGFNIPKIC